MKHFLGCIPPLAVVLVASAYAYAQNGVTTVSAPAADLTTIITGIGTGGLTIWFCMKWVASELDRAKEAKEALVQKHIAEIDKINTDWKIRIEEAERRWRQDYSNALASRDAERELRLQEFKDYQERLKEMVQSQQNNNQMIMEGVRHLAQMEGKQDGSKT